MALERVEVGKARHRSQRQKFRAAALLRMLAEMQHQRAAFVFHQ